MGKEEDFKILNDEERAAQFETNRKETESEKAEEGRGEEEEGTTQI